MVNLTADPPQGRENGQQLRTTGRFSIVFISPPQGISPNGGLPSLDSELVEEVGGVFDNLLYDGGTGGFVLVQEA